MNKNLIANELLKIAKQITASMNEDEAVKEVEQIRKNFVESTHQAMYLLSKAYTEMAGDSFALSKKLKNTKDKKFNDTVEDLDHLGEFSEEYKSEISKWAEHYDSEVINRLCLILNGLKILKKNQN